MSIAPRTVAAFSWLRFDLAAMSKKDAARWASARSMADLGEMVIEWLNGEIQQTPGHCAPPCDETIPLTSALIAINRGGFVTDNSQLAESRAGWTWNTWVEGFAPDATLIRLREAVAGTPLILTACRRRVHECDRAHHWSYCPWSEVTGQWADRCPAVTGELYDSWFVSIADPEPGRNDRLWPALRDALTADVTP